MGGGSSSGARAIGDGGRDSATAIGSGRGRAKVATNPSAASAVPTAPNRTPLYAGLGIAAVLLLGLGGWAMFGGSDPPPTPTPTPVAVVAPPPPAVPVPEPVAAPEVTPPPTARGQIIVHVDVAGATVHVGETELAAADADRGYAVEPGTHHVRVEHPERRTFEVDVEVAAGEEEVVDVHLEPRVVVPTRPPGRLSINTRPWSKVYVGGRLLGTTPIGEATVTSGSVRLRIVDRDGRTFNRTVTVPAGEEASVFFDLDE
jgi:eukaryotic-like serine/threonine-protein kinase